MGNHLASAEDARCVALVFAEGTPVGCAFTVLADERLLLVTCAHVVNAALGRDERDQALPTGTVTVAPWFARSDRCEVRVAADGWLPIAPDGGGDVAVLEPVGVLPPAMLPAPLRSWAHRTALPFKVLGFPAGYKTVGQHAVGVMTGGIGPGGQWVQLDGETVKGARITRGFSGSAVWDTSTQTVVGMVVAEDRRETASASGAMVPIEVVCDLAAPVRPALGVGVHPLAELARHVGSGGELPLVRDVAASAVGATPTVYDRQPDRGAYVHRELDAELREAIRVNAFVLVVGPSKAGKSRTSWEAARAMCGDHVLLEPRDRSALVRLLTEDPAHLAGRRTLVWLDELDRFLRREGERGLDLDLLLASAEYSPAWRIVATMLDTRHRRLYAASETLGADWRGIAGWRSTLQLALPVTLNETERVEAALAFPEEDFGGGVGLGERLIAGPELLRKLDAAEHPLGWALTRAAIDWARTGLENPALLDDLQRLAETYVAQRFPLAELSPVSDALAWMLEPVVSHVALVRVEQSGDRRAIRPLEYLVAAADGQGGPRSEAIAPAAWSLAAERSEGYELFGIVAEAVRRHDQAGILAAAPKARATLDLPAAAAISAECLGRVLLDRGRAADALEPLHQAVAQGDEAIRAHALEHLGDAYRGLGDNDQAIAFYRQAIASGHDHTVDSALIELGDLYQDLGDDESALATYELACARSYAVGWFKRSLLLKQRGELEAAAGAAAEYAEAQQTAGAWFHAALLAAEADQVDSADKYYAAAIQAAHDQPETLASAAYQRGRLLHEGRPEVAATAYRTAIEHGSGPSVDASALMLASLVADPTEQLELLERSAASEDSGVVADALLGIAQVHLRLDESEAALDAARRCADFDPQVLGRSGAVRLADVFWQLDRRDDAERLYERARTLEDAPADLEATLGLARVRIEQGAQSDAVELLRPWTDHPSAAVAARAGELLGKALIALGDLEQGLDAYRHAAKRPGPEGRSALERLGYQLWQADRPKEALEALRPLLDESDERLRAHANTLTGMILEAEDPSAAAEAFRKVIGTHHSHCVADAHFHLGDLSERAGNIDGAIEHYHGAVEARSGISSSQAALRLASLLPERGQRVQAIETLTQALPELEVGGRLAFNLGLLLHDDGQLNRAMLQFEDALNAAEATGDETIVGLAGRNVAALAAQRGDMDAHDSALQRAITGGDPANAALAALDLTTRALGRGDYQEAERLLHAALDKEDEPTAPRAWLTLADVLRMRGRTTDAFTALTRAERANASDALLVEIEITRGAFAFDSGDLDRAEAAFSRALSTATGDLAATAEYNLGLLRWERGDRAGADASLRALMSTDVHAIAHLSALKLAEWLQPDDDEAALAILEELADSQPWCMHSQQAALAAGEQRLARNELDRAHQLLERAMAGPVPVVADYAKIALAAVSECAGDPGQAIGILRTPLASEDEDVAALAQTNMASLLVETGRLDEAAAILAPMIDAPPGLSRDRAVCVYGDLLLRRGDYQESRRSLLDAADSKDPEVKREAEGLLERLQSVSGPYSPARST